MKKKTAGKHIPSVAKKLHCSAGVMGFWVYLLLRIANPTYNSLFSVSGDIKGDSDYDKLLGKVVEDARLALLH